MIKINRETGEVTGGIDIEKAWEMIVEAYAKLPADEEETE